MKRTLYTAVGHFRCKTDKNGNSYPVVFAARQEYLLDPQEMAVWTALNWRLLDAGQANAAPRSLWPYPIFFSNRKSFSRGYEQCVS